jgi:hypothetical protein
MPSEKEVREAMEEVKKVTNGVFSHDSSYMESLNIFISLAESWLARKWPEKKIEEEFDSEELEGSSDDNYNYGYKRGKVVGWNAAIDACRLASVVSEKEIGEIIDAHAKRIIAIGFHSKEAKKYISHAIAEYVNGVKNENN